MNSTETLSADVGVVQSCSALGVPRSTLYAQRHRKENPTEPKQRPASPRALSPDERNAVLEVAHSERFVDTSPAEICATLIDENKYFCSERTMYRILASHGETKERRNQRRHPIYKKPELLATVPNQVWSWDITKLKGPVKWTYYYLYVILDIYSRYVSGWLLANRESTALAKRFISETCEKQQIEPGQLIIHSDRGPSMASKGVAQLLADLGTTKSHSRPHVSNDNPFSESHFKTMKYMPKFPQRFGSQEDGRSFCRSFFDWYNTKHRHGGIVMLTPENVHYGDANEILRARHQQMLIAYQNHPERFVNGSPKLRKLRKAVWINPPEINNESQ
jgi:putative transposase